MVAMTVFLNSFLYGAVSENLPENLIDLILSTNTLIQALLIPICKSVLFYILNAITTFATNIYLFFKSTFYLPSGHPSHLLDFQGFNGLPIKAGLAKFLWFCFSTVVIKRKLGAVTFKGGGNWKKLESHKML